MALVSILMSQKSFFVGEAFGALRTRKRLLGGVSPLMDGEIGFLTVALAAIAACIWLLFYVRYFMAGKASFLGETFPALGARERLLARVNGLMPQETGSAEETFVHSEHEYSFFACEVLEDGSEL